MAKKRRVARGEPTGPTKLLKTKKLRLAERVGFVPVVPSPINDLGPIGSPQTAKSTQNLSIKYKTGTAQLSSVAAGHGSCNGLLNR